MDAQGRSTRRRRELAERIRMRRRAWQRAVRLWSGMILLAFLTTHLLNHALGIFGLDALQAGQNLRLAVWQSLAGTILLYGALAVHAGFAATRMMDRRTWRMPLDEALQIVLGIAIPALLVAHVVGTRILHDFMGHDEGYATVLRGLWWTRPGLQTLLVICAWTHGIIGLDHTFKTKSWFAPWRPLGLVAAVLLPVLSLAGFVAGSREATTIYGPPELPSGPAALVGPAIAQGALVCLALIAATLLAVLAARELWRRRGGRVQIRYVGHGSVRISRGLSVLEASRINGIPHPARCGGRARCSTCRILVIEGLDTLPEPVEPELGLLERIAAPRNVRLACQVHPSDNLAVQVLLPTPVRRGWQGGQQNRTDTFGEEQDVTVLVVDIRAFDALVRRQLPHDLVILLNRFIAEMTQTVRAHDGRVETLVTDGLIAVFGLTAQYRSGARNAILAAHDMLKVRRTLDLELGSALPIPLRIGIGIHTGHAVVARLADPALGEISLTMGETVSIAARLEKATKTVLADCLISDAALAASGLRLPDAVQREILLPGFDRPIIVHAISDSALAPVPA